jgi:hypothetical protein
VLTVTSQRRQRQQLAQDEYGDEAHTDLPNKSPPSIGENDLLARELEIAWNKASRLDHRAGVGFDISQAPRLRVATDEHAKAERDLELNNDSSHSEFGAEYEELGDYEFQRPATVRS